jgi:hypothetical protein
MSKRIDETFKEVLKKRQFNKVYSSDTKRGNYCNIEVGFENAERLRLSFGLEEPGYPGVGIGSNYLEWGEPGWIDLALLVDYFSESKPREWNGSREVFSLLVDQFNDLYPRISKCVGSESDYHRLEVELEAFLKEQYKTRLGF